MKSTLKNSSLTVEHFLFLLAFLVALSLRLANLRALPLNDHEAEWALQAYEIATGKPVLPGPQPLYLTLTAVVFGFFGSSEALARLWPVLLGSGLVALPYLLRHRLGRVTAVLMAFGLALDPGLVAAARLAGGPMSALTTGLLALAVWLTGRYILAGVFAALALLSGPAVLAGLVGLLIAWALGRVAGLDQRAIEGGWGRLRPSRDELRQFGLAAGSTLLLTGTLFLRFPQGLSALGGVFAAYFAGWWTPATVPVAQLLLALPVYQPLALLFGLAAIVRAWTQNRTLGRALSLWFGVALVLALAYPARQVTDLVWVLIPLWGLAALELPRYLSWELHERPVAWGQAALVLVLAAFLWLDLASLTTLSPGTQLFNLRLLVAGAVVGLGLLATLLIGLGWSSRAAARGVTLGLLVFLGVYLLAVAWRAPRNRDQAANELWLPQPAIGQVYLFDETLADLSRWSTGHRAQLDVVSLIDAPSLRWALRAMPQARFATLLSDTEAPSVILTADSVDAPGFADSYRGQRFAWWVYPQWGAATPPDFVSWLIFRQAPTLNQGVILWARSDVFPRGTTDPLDFPADPGLPGPLDGG